MSVEIVEILGRSKQGMTKPFLCEGDDGYRYYVKGRGAGRRSLIAEYICGCLAQSFGLPMAHFEIVEVCENLIELADEETKRDLGVGVAFASRVTPQLQEMTKPQVEKVDIQLRRDLLVFDWWVRNADRTLTESGGNPNLLWNSVTNEMQVIDHNQAFDREFNANDFRQTHVFCAEMVNVFDDMIEQANYADRLSDVFGTFDTVCDNIPPSWWWVDDGVPADFDVNVTKQVLAGFLDRNFWRIV